jgi:hypothetical protein
MKKQLLALVVALATQCVNAQTATDFTANDCNGVSHNLFSELDAGKVIVLCWVMPCASCTGPALTTYNVVQSYQATYPNQVFYYLVDDYANTVCASLNSWANANGISASSWKFTFVNSAIKMTDYGQNGMPKIVVVGGSNHAVYYNSNNTVSSEDLQNAISSALAAIGTAEAVQNFSSLKIFPNPSSSEAKIMFTLAQEAEVALEVYSLQGQLLDVLLAEKLAQGQHEVIMDVSGYALGTYLIRIQSNASTGTYHLVVNR